jgi:hypothetical protein
MKLIREVNESLKLIEENKLGKGKQLFVEGIFLQSNIKNRNGRMYPESVMDNEVNRYIKEKVNKNTAFGELGHPDSPSINLDRISHLITSLRKEGHNWIGKAKILDTPMGRIAEGIIKGGGQLGTSSRALGSLKMNNEGINVVQNDFMLSTAGDLVSDPSAPDAWVQGIMESADWVYVDGKFERQVDEARRSIRAAKSNNLDEAKILAFQQFLKSIR